MHRVAMLVFLLQTKGCPGLVPRAELALGPAPVPWSVCVTCIDFRRS